MLPCMPSGNSSETLNLLSLQCKPSFGTLSPSHVSTLLEKLNSPLQIPSSPLVPGFPTFQMSPLALALGLQKRLTEEEIKSELMVQGVVAAAVISESVDQITGSLDFVFLCDADRDQLCKTRDIMLEVLAPFLPPPYDEKDAHELAGAYIHHMSITNRQVTDSRDTMALFTMTPCEPCTPEVNFKFYQNPTPTGSSLPFHFSHIPVAQVMINRSLISSLLKWEDERETIISICKNEKKNEEEEANDAVEDITLHYKEMLDSQGRACSHGFPCSRFSSSAQVSAYKTKPKTAPTSSSTASGYAGKCVEIFGMAADLVTCQCWSKKPVKK